MNNQFIKKALVLVLSFMVLSAFSNIAYSANTLSGLATYKEVVGAETNTSDRYALPPSKVNIESCRREALRLHPGAIEKQRILHRHGDFLVRFQIQGRDGLDWFMLCDLATREVIDAF